MILDKSGRVLLPKEIRDKLGLSEGTPLEVTVRGSEIVIRPYDKGLEERVEEAVKFLSENAPRAFVTQEEGDKWFSREYCLRKIGLKE
ncbi:MAG: AbrB/MazE/SpoVT family DNA-binding domain-containing protein [Candidatus Freyarchaeum deiterrae]